MAKNRKALTSVAAFALTSVAAISNSYAATDAKPVTFDNTVTSNVFSVTPKGWSDPAFGDMGWTHSSGWGLFTATKGQTVTITMIAPDKGIHPAATVWYRSDKDTADNKWVVDHFYPQNANLFKKGAKDDNGATIGITDADGKFTNDAIIMKYVKHGYDLDKNTVTDSLLKGINDGTSGRLVLTFKAPSTGDYMIVVGGFNPDSNIDTTLKYNVTTKVTVK